jgi:SAM-dependent methyltransferase
MPHNEQSHLVSKFEPLVTRDQYGKQWFPTTGQFGPETANSMMRRIRTGVISRYLNGVGLDIGFRGSIPDALPFPGAIGIELDYPGYYGRTLPFADESQDFVYSSHCLEHISDAGNALRDYHRVLKIGGFMLIAVPHKYLYEKKWNLPSRYNGDHKRFYTPMKLMAEIEDALQPNSYRLRHLQDCDDGFDYSIGPDRHSCGEYQVECVIEKIKMPKWGLT